MQHKILIVEDDKPITELLKTILYKNYELLFADDVKSAIDVVNSGKPDLVLLDLMLPDGSGLKVCKYIRKKEGFNNTAVLMLTAKTEQDDKISGFKHGADDYVTKPFNPKELVLRVKALLRRVPLSVGQDEMIVKKGIVVVNLKTGNIKVGKESIKGLRPKEIELLYTLMANSPKIVSRDYLLKKVFGYEKIIPTRTVDVHIQRIRRQLGSESRRIKSVSRMGYKFLP